ncbi:tRNA (adenosine(37)-N6)-threonylcarbamoyltransferase complex dimerization subunit type 1 TsaB [Bacillus tianshenii]|uniref:tRNA (adenosine(37)-N6)-threonylcarbamoyltransferase complex dimerization subunit type 1 TsaB n=1 Tax=Sutcliffiella tianshenii TaxID=1463404 RepID=UPI001CD5E4C5|nr:tRNA (adenosine(37)-N6)-threonylcarbamoyltransferase complex dimerization subunit type 1 TsaB [Bacillus tianshenii]MCA1322143.1 tRNA (adenosine(37)-N6)-threonylcarbamoyltransferase complex dimerization subunit type 1 TsaB [Bacillus tianshenii]
MTRVLAIDTSSYVLGVAVVEEDRVIGELVTNLNKNHSVRAMPAVERLLKDCEITPDTIDRIVVGRGPGSFTGVRIGVTLAKTLAWSLNVPLVGVSSLELLAANGRYFKGMISPIMDARRGQVYTGLFSWEKAGVQTLVEDVNIALTDWLGMLKEKNEDVLFIGNDVHLHKETIIEYLGEMAHFAQTSENCPRPSELALIGLDREAEDVHSFVPNYTRLAEAEAKWLESKEK